MRAGETPAINKGKKVPLKSTGKAKQTEEEEEEAQVLFCSAQCLRFNLIIRHRMLPVIRGELLVYGHVSSKAQFPIRPAACLQWLCNGSYVVERIWHAEGSVPGITH